MPFINYYFSNMKRKGLLTTLLWGCVVICSLAQVSLSGKVVNVKNGKPIEGVNVRLEQTTIGCATNSKGEFILKNVPDESYTLRASCLNYIPVEKKIHGTQLNMLIEMENSGINLDQVVITGTGTHRRIQDSPVPVEIINGNDLKRAGITNFKDALNMLNPSFSFSTTAMASYMTLNGLGNKHILVLINGQKLAGDVSGNVDLSRINLSNVKRIEILKGAASSLYGSEAMGGVINIITDQPKNLINVTSETRFAEENQFDQTINLDINTGKFGSFTTYNRRQSDGWQLNNQAITYDSKGNEKLTETNKKASDKFYSNILTQHFTYSATKALSFYARGSMYNKENDRPVSEYDYNLAYNDYSLALGSKFLLGNASYISLDLYNDNFEGTKEYIKDVKDKKGNITIKNGTSALSKRQHYYNANLKSVFMAGDFNKIIIGSEYITDKLKNPEALAGDKQAYTMALYTQDEIKFLQNFQAIVGLRYIYHETFKNRFTPKLSLMYSPGAFNFRATYSSGFRAPSLEELYYNKEKNGTLSAGNINLKPEKSNYYAINGEFMSRLFSISATAYINNLDNLITSKQVALTETDIANSITKRMEYQNVDKARVKGVDISINSYLGYGVSLGGSYSYADAKDTNTDSRLPRSIKHSGSINSNWNKVWGFYTLNVNLAGRLQSKRFETGTYGNAPGYQLWNLSTRHTFNNLANFILEPGIGIENIFNYRDDRPYNSNYATLSPGRTFYISLLLKFRK